MRREGRERERERARARESIDKEGRENLDLIKERQRGDGEVL